MPLLPRSVVELLDRPQRSGADEIPRRHGRRQADEIRAKEAEAQVVMLKSLLVGRAA